MFSVSAFKLIRRNCPEDFDKLLKLLAVDNPNWELDDEFKLAQELDRKIDKKLCALLDSDSDIDGYAKLLECGEVEFSFSETRKDLLKKILLNRDRILRDSSDYTQSPKIKITCNRAESAFDVKNKSFLDNIQASVKEFCSALKDGDIKRLIPQKEEISLKSSAQQAIRNILAKEYDLNNCEEISISIIEKKSSSPRKTLSSFKLDAKTFEVLEQIDKIFNKI